MNAFFADLGKRWSVAARARGADIEPPTLDAGVAEELLELARAAAHVQERRFAPLACYMAGAAAERLRAAQPATTEGDVAAFIAEVRRALEHA
ncbi:MAG: hypothetical protein E6J02_00965 [Chloroflexi bacterium]|nr:MAG: hypothetical protein E6J02_00965 [Chloroflexota bacterium]TME16546.1 MAG: hypothetical protein E6I63_06130 [Chloroflexota bacterium]TME20663.1 MAG: hypothetical protein E6I70_00915 [Chloroflexota bacterium]